MAKTELLSLFRQMLLIRRFEEDAAEMYARGKIGGFLHLVAHSSLGVEDSTVASSAVYSFLESSQERRAHHQTSLLDRVAAS